MVQDDIHNEIREKAKKVKLLLLDVDGVLTDGRIIYDSEGRELKFFNVQDGLGVRLLEISGVKIALVTTRRSPVLERRVKDMGVDRIYEGILRKTGVLDQILDTYQVRRDEVCYVGDDLVDLGIMRLVGFPVAVKNACQEVKDAASYVTERKGGEGAVREVSELILKVKGTWDRALRSGLNL